MNNKQAIITYWFEKAHQDLASARDNLSNKRLQNAVRDIYFACFHAFSAILFQEGRTFEKHHEVRAMLHRDYIKTGRIEVSWGKHYDWLFDNRHEADYRPLVSFQPDEVEKAVEQSAAFITKREQLLSGAKI